MSGVTILSQSTVYYFEAIGIVCCIVSFVCLMIGLVEKHVPTIIISLCLIVFGIYNIINPLYRSWNETHYKIIVDNSVKMNDFNTYYKVISQDGKIYIVTIRN